MPPAFRSSKDYRLNATLDESKRTVFTSLTTSQYGAATNDAHSSGIICISQIPVLNIFDLTKSS
jgi:hypothetical protein